ncbi:MAG: hypothetical protein DRP78_02235 [Candidatus Omnitrophota bacterium]|nr:MAG: hypothetical protein DRP78_02235 [Candidatus Omnitrophota bacterium]
MGRKFAFIVLAVNCVMLIFLSAGFAEPTLLNKVEVKEDNSVVKVLFATNKNISIECYDLTNPPQIVVDFMGKIYTNKPETILVDKDVIKQMRLIKGAKKSSKLDASYYPLDFIIFDLNKAVRYDFSQGLNSAVLTVLKSVLKPVAEEKKIVPKEARAVVVEPVSKGTDLIKESAVKSELQTNVVQINKKKKVEKVEKVEKVGKDTVKKKRKFFIFGKKKDTKKDKQSKKNRKLKRKKKIKSKKILNAKKKSVKKIKTPLALVEDAKAICNEKRMYLQGLKENFVSVEEQLKTVKAERDMGLKSLKLEEKKRLAAKSAFGISLKAVKRAKKLANAMWLQYSDVKDDLSNALNQKVKKEVILELQHKYDQKKTALEQAINETKKMKKESDTKLLFYKEAEDEFNILSAKADNPEKIVDSVQEVYNDLKKEIKAAESALLAARKQLDTAEIAYKQYTLNLSAKQYEASLAQIDDFIENEDIMGEEVVTDTQVISQKHIEVKKAEKNAVIEKREISIQKKQISPKRRKKTKISDKNRIFAKKDSNQIEELKSAVQLRNAGLQMQRQGDFTNAIKYYQKALLIDPDYITVHNDLGILYEQRGMDEKAKTEYLVVLKLDPRYVKAHSNLALLYEKLGDNNKAYYHWKQRAQLGDVNDPWTQKAKDKLKEYKGKK